MRTSLTLVAVAMLAVTIVAMAAVIKDRPTASSNGSDIVIRWNTESEAGVQQFVVVRRAGTEGEFIPVATVTPKGDRSSYEYIDRSVFKTSASLFQYRIRVVNGQTPAPETEIVTVSHVSSTARRTWGSIKAMFR
jgi:hypothetical protein